MNRKYLVIATLILFFGARGLVQGQDKTHTACAFDDRNIEAQFDSVEEIIMGLSELGLAQKDEDLLWSAFDASRSCNNAFGCAFGAVSDCMQPLVIATQEVLKEENLPANVENPVKFVLNSTTFVVGWASEDLGGSIDRTIPQVEGKNCTAEIAYFSRGKVQDIGPFFSIAFGNQTFIENNMPEGTYSWTARHSNTITGTSSNPIVGPANGKTVTIRRPGCDSEESAACVLSIEVLKTVEGEECFDWKTVF